MALLPIQIQMLENIKQKYPEKMADVFVGAVQNGDEDTYDYIAEHYLDLLDPQLQAIVRIAQSVTEVKTANPERVPEVDAIIQQMGEEILARDATKH